MKFAIKKIGYVLPPRTEDAAVLVNDNPDWRMDDIERKTGVKLRHVVEAGKNVVDLGADAAEKLFDSGVSRDDIGFLILVTQSPVHPLPTSACMLQDRLGLLKTCMAFDVNLGCSGFVYGLALGGSLIESGFAKKGLLICSETYSKYIDKHDRTCRPLFSDGAAATLLEASDDDVIGPFEMGTDGSGAEDLCVRSGELSMKGSEVLLFTMSMVPKCVTNVLKKAEMTVDDIDLFVFHQASKLVMESIIRRLSLPEEKVFMNLENVGNTVSASIPIALKDADDAGKLKSGDTVMLVGFGVGYSWGACIMIWGL
jgi:3-oxoacyl-[acyl-carrier-protein] synthase III